MSVKQAKNGTVCPTGVLTRRKQRAISLFSGAGGFDLGLERAGIETVLQCEIDPIARSVLQRHWPDVPKVNDVRDLTAESVYREWRPAMVGTTPDHAGAGLQTAPPPIDLLYGGFPCTDVSIAGKRAGLEGDHSGLWFEFERVLSELRPALCLIENVPGLLSSNDGRDFAVVLNGLENLGYGWAYRILDAQFFGVAQCRRRVFIVGCAGGAWHRAAEILALCEGCDGDTATRQAAREDIAGTFGGGTGSRGYADDTDRMIFVPVAQSDALRGRDGGSMAELGDDKANAIRASQGGGDRSYVATWDERQITSKANRSTVEPGKPANTRPDDAQRRLVHGVRRLTPRETERCFGWPDDWTRWTADGKEIADSHRYRMVGNGVASPVAEWIGRRLVAAT